MAKAKTTLEWLQYYVEKAREEGYTVSGNVSKLNDEGVSEGGSL